MQPTSPVGRWNPDKGEPVLFNHTAVQIDLDHIDDAVALFSDVLGFEEVFRLASPNPALPADMRMLRQPAANVDLQLTGLERVAPQDRKIMNHYGFISDDADADVATVAEWCEARSFEVTTGLYMPRMFWIDVPQLFLDFVLEVMDAAELRKYEYPWPPAL